VPDTDADVANSVISKTHTETDKLGIILCLLTGLFFGLSIILAKLAYEYGMTPTTFAAARAFSSVVVCIGMALATKSLWKLPKSARSEIIPVTVLFLMIAFGYPAAMKYVPASIASLTFYLFPLIVLAIGSIRERQFPGIRRMSIYLAAFVGLGVVLAPALDELNWLGILCGVIAAFGAALFMVKVPKIMSETNGMVVNVYANSLNVIVLLGAALVFGEFMFPTETMGWLIIALAGLLYGIGTVLVVFAVKRTEPALASIFFNLEPLVVAILAAILFAEFLSPVQYFGMIIVVVALIFASRRASTGSRTVQ
jgi:drug/metabolite transporter (DMT)-like permease